MIRELVVNIYLTVFRVVFLFFKCFPRRKKTLFIPYFGYNVLATMEELEKHSKEPIVVVTSRHTHVTFEEKERRKNIDLKKFKLHKWLAFVYHLATSDKVVVDNYYGFLAVTSFKKNTKCIQLWHATGAVKTFALEDNNAKNRSERAKKRFKSVYKRFTHVIVGSDEMSEVFQVCFGLEEDRMVKTGIPRTDFFFNEQEKKRIEDKLYEQYPLLKEKKILLYAPTFRDNQMEVEDFSLDIKKMYESFKDEYILIVKTHPLVKNKSGNDYPDFVLDLSRYKNINHLLLLADVLISDYSSVPFEFALLERPIIYYAYDLEEYTKNRGIWKNYEDMVGGPIVRTTEELVRVIKNNEFDKKKLVAFKEKWNVYSNGQSSKNLVEKLWKSNKK